jgi:hypothetical protein
VELEKLRDRGISPVEYLISVVNDEKAPANQRIAAANSVAPYVHSRRASTLSGSLPQLVQGDDGGVTIDMTANPEPAQSVRDIFIISVPCGCSWDPETRSVVPSWFSTTNVVPLKSAEPEPVEPEPIPVPDPTSSRRPVLPPNVFFFGGNGVDDDDPNDDPPKAA